MIDYCFAGDPDDKVVMEILDANGNLIRSYASERKEIQPSPGMNRFFWDMRHAGAWNQRAGRGERGEPVVAPGIYQAKLFIGDWTHTERFRVLVDPRVTEDGVTQAALKAQESLSLQVRDSLSLANRLVERIRKAQESEKISRKNKEKLAALYAKLVTATGPYPQPMLVDQLSYLSSMLNRADQKPGRDAYVRFDELDQELSIYVSEVNKILGDS
jgi:hypothetical protein